jgi:hypothetical protein
MFATCKYKSQVNKAVLSNKKALQVNFKPYPTSTVGISCLRLNLKHNRK